MALTFDAGANGDGVDAILATLVKEKVAASFYLTGDFVNSFPTLAVRMSAAGRLGNHTANHLPRVIAGLQAAGYGFVTLDALGAG